MPIEYIFHGILGIKPTIVLVMERRGMVVKTLLSVYFEKQREEKVNNKCILASPKKDKS